MATIVTYGNDDMIIDWIPITESQLNLILDKSGVEYNVGYCQEISLNHIDGILSVSSSTASIFLE